MIRAAAILLPVVLLSACESGKCKGALQLHCVGQQVVDAQPATRLQRDYRIDLQAGVLEDWSAEANKFVKWGEGSLSYSKDLLTFAGEIRVMDKRVIVRRQLRFVRSTGRIRDQFEASWGSAIAFEGRCAER